jgi:dihydroorotate dehydrogenase
MFHAYRKVLYTLDPEISHSLVLRAAKLPFAGSISKIVFYKEYPELKTAALGLTFPSPVGLAAGFDKNIDAVPTLAALGFGSLELGTITPRPQPGNPKPRLFRYPENEAVINRLGFPSQGVDAVLGRLKSAKNNIEGAVIGVNIGKAKDTAVDKALEDYAEVFDKVAGYSDYVAVNVSSPNTPDLRKLQEKTKLQDILSELQKRNRKKVPLLVKISPDLTFAEIDDIIEVVLSTGINGIIATNTTISRENFAPGSAVQGGLSGKPLKMRALEVVNHLSKSTQGKLTIIGVGGISSADDVVAMLRAGASLVQLYSSLVFHGPGLIAKINKDLSCFMKKNEIRSLDEIRLQKAGI